MNPESSTQPNRGRGGFTLIELIISIGIITMLSIVGFGAYGAVKNRAMMAKEMAAARRLMSGFHLYSAENNGRILSGYESDPDAVNEFGRRLSAPANARYPWRIYPYLQEVKLSLLFNGNEETLDQPNSDYLVSVSPNLGMNATFIGGHFGSGSLLRPSARIEEVVGRFAVRHAGEIVHAAKLIVFLSARNDPEESWEGRGYFEVQPPAVMASVWSEDVWAQDALPSAHGFVDLRWGGKAVAGMLDGSARAFTEAELRDMRHWSPAAAEENNPDYVVTRR